MDSITATTAGNLVNLNAGQVVTVTVHFTDAVDVSGAPVLTLNDGQVASYSSGTGTNVQTADVDESDVAKTDGHLLVRVSGRMLVVTDVSGDRPVELSRTALPGAATVTTGSAAALTATGSTGWPDATGSTEAAGGTASSPDPPCHRPQGRVIRLTSSSSSSCASVTSPRST